MNHQSIFFYQSEQAGFVNHINQNNYKKIFLLADAKSNGFCVPILKKIFPVLQYSFLIVIPDGEANKNIDVCKLIWSTLLNNSADKESVLINVGGGMVSDIGGFAASTFKRGIDFLNIPTTLLAMVDASHGGKNGVDLLNTKNVIGTFCNPKAIYVDPIFLRTLSQNVLQSGIAEMLKHSLLASEDFFKVILSSEVSDFYTISAIKRSIQIKTDIVYQDPFDERIRQTLNLGHSIGHAIESFALHAGKLLLHGEAVMLGLIYELMLSNLIFEFPQEIISKVIDFKRFIYQDLFVTFDYKDIEIYLRNDKKNTSDIRMSLLERVGLCRWQVSVSNQLIERAITQTNLLLSKNSNG